LPWYFQGHSGVSRASSRHFCARAGDGGAPAIPQVNGATERFVRTVRTECLDRLLVLNQPHLEWIRAVFVDHYNGHRPHGALSLTPPESRRPAASPSACGDARILRRDCLGGVVHEYERAV
jgi:putative transposase